MSEGPESDYQLISKEEPLENLMQNQCDLGMILLQQQWEEISSYSDGRRFLTLSEPAVSAVSLWQSLHLL